MAWTVSSTSNIKTNFNNVGRSPAYEWPLDLLYCILRPLLARLTRYPVFLHSFYLLTLDDEPPAVPYRRLLPRVNQCRGTCFRDSLNPTSSTPTPFSPSHTSRESPTNPCRPYNKHRYKPALHADCVSSTWLPPSPTSPIANATCRNSRYADHVGIHYVLCQKLRQFPYEDIEFFLPQLCHLIISVHNESMALEEFLLDLCEESVTAALLVRVMIQPLRWNARAIVLSEPR